MRRALLLAAVVVTANLLFAGVARAALPPDDPEPATGWNCVRKVQIPALDNVFDTEWSPDGSRLALVRTVRVPSAAQVSGYQELEVLETLDLRTGHVRFFGEGTRPAWSASGRYLSYWGYEADYLTVDDGEKTVGLLTPSIPEYRWAGDTLVYIEKSTIRAWSEEPATIRKFDLDEIPHYPVDDVYWSGDGSHYTVTRYDPERPEPERFISRTASGPLQKLELPGAVLTEWSPSGTELLVRYATRLEIRDQAGRQLASIATPAGAVHQWGPAGALLQWTARPFTAGGDGFVDVPVVWPKQATARVPNLSGPRSFSWDGRHFSGVARTGPHQGRLVVYRCLELPGATTPDPDMTAGSESLAAAKGRLIRPAHGPISQFMQALHTGIDVGAPLGSPILAADDGIVRAAGWVRGGGFRVCVGHNGGLETCYFHTATVLVRVGERVVRGQPVALVGMSGLTRGPHVHWEARFLGRLVDPLSR